MLYNIQIMGKQVKAIIDNRKCEAKTGNGKIRLEEGSPFLRTTGKREAVSPGGCVTIIPDGEAIYKVLGVRDWKESPERRSSTLRSRLDWISKIADREEEGLRLVLRLRPFNLPQPLIRGGFAASVFSQVKNPRFGFGLNLERSVTVAVSPIAAGSPLCAS